MSGHRTEQNITKNNSPGLQSRSGGVSELVGNVGDGTRSGLIW